MKKLFLFFIAFILIIQIINFVTMPVTYDWIFIVMIFISIAIFALIYICVNYGKIVKSFKNKEYDYVISKENCYLARNTSLKNNIFYMIAISYLEKGEKDKFFEYTNKIESKDLYLSKCFLMIIYSLITEDTTLEAKWREDYNNIPINALKNRYDEILNLLRKSKSSQCVWTIAEMKAIESIKIDAIKEIILKCTMEN